MKTKSSITFFILIFVVIILSCSNKKTNNNTQVNGNLTNKLKDTVSMEIDSTVLSQYLLLDSIKNGDPFTDKNHHYGFYRLLFSSSEELQSIYVEKIDIIGDGIVKLEKRFKLSPRLSGNNDEFTLIRFINWETPEIIKVDICDTIRHLNLTVFKNEAFR